MHPGRDLASRIAQRFSAGRGVTQDSGKSRQGRQGAARFGGILSSLRDLLRLRTGNPALKCWAIFARRAERPLRPAQPPRRTTGTSASSGTRGARPPRAHWTAPSPSSRATETPTPSGNASVWRFGARARRTAAGAAALPILPGRRRRLRTGHGTQPRRHLLRRQLQRGEQGQIIEEGSLRAGMLRAEAAEENASGTAHERFGLSQPFRGLEQASKIVEADASDALPAGGAQLSFCRPAMSDAAGPAVHR